MEETSIRRDENANDVGLLRGWKPMLTASIGAFIGRIDSFYLGTADATGQPYIQHRGGPPGFLRVIDPHTLAFADFSGNRQYVTVGHLATNPRAFLFLMDYERQQRVKIFGTARVTHEATLLRVAAVDGYDADIERAIVFDVRGWTANCPQHIPRRFAEATVIEETAALRARIASLEEENARLKHGIAVTP
jgi:uncharacterized protein